MRIVNKYKWLRLFGINKVVKSFSILTLHTIVISFTNGLSLMVPLILLEKLLNLLCLFYGVLLKFIMLIQAAIPTLNVVKENLLLNTMENYKLKQWML